MEVNNWVAGGLAIIFSFSGCYNLKHFGDEFKPAVKASLEDLNGDEYDDIILTNGFDVTTTLYGMPDGNYYSLRRIVENTEEKIREDFMKRYSPLEERVGK